MFLNELSHPLPAKVAAKNCYNHLPKEKRTAITIFFSFYLCSILIDEVISPNRLSLTWFFYFKEDKKPNLIGLVAHQKHNFLWFRHKGKLIWLLTWVTEEIWLLPSILWPWLIGFLASFLQVWLTGQGMWLAMWGPEKCYMSKLGLTKTSCTSSFWTMWFNHPTITQIANVLKLEKIRHCKSKTLHV